MAGNWRVTFETVTPESAADGEAAESGWALAGGWKFPAEDKAAAAERYTLREALEVIGYDTRPSRHRPAGLEDSGRWFSTVDPERDYQDGSETSYSVHPPEGITRASYRRAARVLAGRGI